MKIVDIMIFSFLNFQFIYTNFVLELAYLENFEALKCFDSFFVLLTHITYHSDCFPKKKTLREIEKMIIFKIGPLKSIGISWLRIFCCQDKELLFRTLL